MGLGPDLSSYIVTSCEQVLDDTIRDFIVSSSPTFFLFSVSETGIPRHRFFYSVSSISTIVISFHHTLFRSCSLCQGCRSLTLSGSENTTTSLYHSISDLGCPNSPSSDPSFSITHRRGPLSFQPFISLRIYVESPFKQGIHVTL